MVKEVESGVICVFRDPNTGIGIGMSCMELGSECSVECYWSVSEVDRVGCLHGGQHMESEVRGK